MKVVLLSGAVVGAKTRNIVDILQGVINRQFPEVESTLLDLAAYDVEFSDGRVYWDYGFASDTRYVASTVLGADGLIIVAPVYQASIPAPLKNVFDLLPLHALRDTVAGIAMIAASARHFMVPEYQLKPILSYLRAPIVPHYVFMEEKDFDEDNHLINAEVGLRLARLVEDTIRLADLHRRQREAPAAPTSD
ncbi:NADPH-dependent FMN reductase [Sulfobacillus harzensis]|uniref:NAD(P)H-dependent oxidoreductase n=1 Tax=Sulfobacillus harzensis TaxID=2729629 RepID=A0A7Y0Q5D1_9FIRM|nr:NADPH-dependent FMN reductase [Sulfobacillus harzensis]NMP24961.1 NAD(P)H-dependent oxidoreductase [Sulfobacillus harzensis]